MPEEKITNCPFCKKLTVRILHQPFVARKSMSKSRFGSGGPKYTKERSEILSGCDACGKSLKEVEKALNSENEGKPHEERLRRLKEAGLPTMIISKKTH